MSDRTIAVDFTADELHVLTCAMAGNFPPTLNDTRMPTLRKLAKAHNALVEADLSAPDDRHSVADCERNLKRMPNYDPHLGVPAVFVCECGRRWEHCHDEAEGDSWVLADGDAESREDASA